MLHFLQFNRIARPGGLLSLSALLIIQLSVNLVSVFIPETPNTLLVSVSFCTVCADWIGKRVVDNWPHSGIKPKLTQQSLRSLCFPTQVSLPPHWGYQCGVSSSLLFIHLPFFLVVFCSISGSCCCLSAKLTTVILLSVCGCCCPFCSLLLLLLWLGKARKVYNSNVR